MAILRLILGKIIGDWRMLVAIGLLILSSLVIFKIKSLESKLNKANEAVQLEKKNNEVLRGNVTILKDTNDQNQRVIGQLERDKQRAITSVVTLSNDMKAVTQSLGTVKQKIDEIKTPPTPLTPYLVEAVEGIQQDRDKLNPPPEVKK